MTNKEKIDKIIEMATMGSTNEEMMNAIGYDKYSSFKSFCYRNKLKMTELRGKDIIISKLNKSYLSNSDFKYYLFGLIASDGTIDKNRNRIRICLHNKDIDILNKIKKVVFENYSDIKYYVSGDEKQYLTLAISDKELKDELFDIGISENKTKNMKIILNDELNNNMSSFMRGYFDGDGSVSITQNKYKDIIYKKYLDCRIIGNKYTMELFYDVLHKNGIDCTLSDITGEKYSFPFFQIGIRRKDQIPKFYNYIYSGSTIHFNRKHDKFNEVL